ncbi:MAG: hypothetical protein J6R47_02175 [Acholeplasmatales bacterium]|nr:hypothetical protein [Acholeplasmatales bacterium]
MFLNLLNKKEMFKFLDLAIYMVDIDGEPNEVEKRVLTKMIAELEEIKNEYSFRLTDTAEKTIDFFINSNQVVKNIVYLNLVIISMEDDLYNTSELLFLESIQHKFGISNDKRRDIISIVYAERDLREKATRIIKN